MTIKLSLQSDPTIKANFQHFLGLYKQLLPNDQLVIEEAEFRFAEFMGKATCKISHLYEREYTSKPNYFTIQLLSNLLLVESVEKGSLMNVGDDLLDMVAVTFNPDNATKFSDQEEERINTLTTNFISDFITSKPEQFNFTDKNKLIFAVANSTDVILNEYLYFYMFAKCKPVSDETIKTFVHLCLSYCTYACLRAESKKVYTLFELMRFYRLSVFEAFKPSPTFKRMM
ncbi:hypothetical protein [Photobacterium leiognathi]|uniref:hypothetical protein n=1 Tax=Photobacterium leiognathi TaxID=553611 RepID=UPI00298263E8|nr:hypothetical protein [Photobacterium leiognathi]